MAEAAGVHRPYLSRVLIDKVHLLPEQLFGICEWLSLPEMEFQYLLLLLERDRSASPKYRAHLEEKIKSLKDRAIERLKEGGRTRSDSFASGDQVLLYYSHWIFPLLHIAVSIPALQSVSKIATAFSLSESWVRQTLESLSQMGFVQRQGNQWKWVKGQWHSPQNDFRSFLLKRNIQDLSYAQYVETPTNGLHLSIVQSLSKADFAKLQDSILDWVKHFNQIASPSPSEVPVIFNCDFFVVGKT